MQDEIKEIQLNLIQSPEYPLDYDYEQILEQYFRDYKGRVLAIMVGDIVAIPVKENAKFFYGNISFAKQRMPPKVIFFQVCQINQNKCKDQLFVYDNGHSARKKPSTIKVYKCANINCIAPTFLNSYVKINGSYISQLSDKLLNNQVQKLSRQFRPYLLGLRSIRTGTFLIKDFGDMETSRKLIRLAAQNWHMHVFECTCLDLLCEMPKTTESKIKNLFAKVSMFAPCVLLITDFDLLYKSDIFDNDRIIDLIQQSIQSLNNQTWPIVVAATDHSLSLTNSHPLSSLSLFVHQMHLEPPDDEQRRLFYSTVMQQIAQSNVTDELSEKKLKAFEKIFIDLSRGLNFGQMLSVLRASFRQHCLSKQREDWHYFAQLIEQNLNKFCQTNCKKNSFEIPNVDWSDIGGLDHIKQEIIDTIQLPLNLGFDFNQLGIKRSGILLHGPPGTGKTLLAKAVASQFKINFISVKGPELISKYVGQSEENVRLLFAQARERAPTIIFFDELDSLAPARGKSGDSGGVMDRVVSQLLTELDGIYVCPSADQSSSSSSSSSSSPPPSIVFVIGATNRVDLIDSALLRPGRFDKIIKVPIAKDKSSRCGIIRALVKNFIFQEEETVKMKRDEIITHIEKILPLNLSGADFYSICSMVMIAAIRRIQHLLNQYNIDNNNESDEEQQEKIDSNFPNVLVNLMDFKHVVNMKYKNNQ